MINDNPHRVRHWIVGELHERAEKSAKTHDPSLNKLKELALSWASLVTDYSENGAASGAIAAGRRYLLGNEDREEREEREDRDAVQDMYKWTDTEVMGSGTYNPTHASANAAARNALAALTCQPQFVAGCIMDVVQSVMKTVGENTAVYRRISRDFTRYDEHTDQ